ncbi:SDR family NAD(P)-dependent oxidoreductase [Actinoplanes lobatus]|uniref:NAD(P)-dependent dehydrogenase (Short-subunit alcohol dehydrogenase family) n=1 Tax=Actinoplanes lobatus TaxID=113568 RepID=A0A7W7MI96_9ACTN|nr:SDR family NAD(P)-dependent oxidoreductase [Actinoplanes lobatus]MBB4751171.1 NAD(P)-dependent dehydrogenase (short-subunit alcohol dehydrogenase family) [Actinoplanes lobatus]GIE44666.1 oxidoreductase [Actinoplanes lobatus]
MGRLDGQVALITGGEGSVGMATARAFVREGARVVLAGIAEPGLAAAGRELGDDAASCTVTDVTDPASVRAAVAHTVRRFGRLDIVFSNAGISGPVAPVAGYPDDEFDRVLAVHVRGSFLTCKYSLPVLSDGGRIVINSSVVGLTSDPGIAAYATAKHAVVGLMRTLAKEVAGRAIRVNTVHPGPIDNDFQHGIETAATGRPAPEAAAVFDEMIPLRRHARPDEIAAVVLFLASADSSFMTGATLVVDGGMSI